MKNAQLVSGLILLLGIFSSGLAFADHDHWHGHGGHVDFGFYVGSPYPYAYYPYPYPDPYYPRVIVVPAPQPPIYIEQGNTSPTQQQAPTPVPQANNYWYHCDKPEGYYPYIRECPVGWQKVVPTPPPQQ